MEIKTAKNVGLAEYTTYGVGGPAKEFIVADSVVTLVKAVQYALTKDIPYFILGGGSNILVSDQGFDGLVIKNETKEILIDTAHSIMQVDTGVRAGRAASEAVSANLSGLEYLFGIPGTIGGAVYGNAGIRGRETKDVLKDVVCLTVKEEAKAVVGRKSLTWLDYQYRSSRIKREGRVNQPVVIISARFQLYPARKEVIMARTKEFINQRQGGVMAGSEYSHGTQPKGLKTAGCVFRNPSPDPARAAGRLLEEIGAKRLTVGGAAVSRDHANFIYNKGQATALDIWNLINLCAAKVKERYGIELEREIELIGDFDAQTSTSKI